MLRNVGTTPLVVCRSDSRGVPLLKGRLRRVVQFGVTRFQALALAGVACTTLACAKSNGNSAGRQNQATGAVERPRATSAVQTCTQKGVAYFKGIGSYPTLSAPPNAGRMAEDVARERCQRTTGAFDGLQ